MNQPRFLAGLIFSKIKVKIKKMERSHSGLVHTLVPISPKSLI